MSIMKSIFFVILFSIFLAGNAFATTELVVYTTTTSDVINRFDTGFKKAHPDIKIKWVRDSTGIIAARMLAEKDNPQADVVYPMAATVLLSMEDQDFFVPYKPEGQKNLNPLFTDRSDPVNWVGNYGWAAAVIYNKPEGKKRNISPPKTWKDLIKPEYKGQIVMPNPASSGTGYLMVTSWMQIWGEKEAWDYMDKLNENVVIYTHSGSKPGKMAASGEFTVGLTFPFRGAQLKEQGAPIDIILPEEGLGWEMQAIAIMKGTKKLDAAKKLVDWSITKEAAKIYSTAYSIYAYPGIKTSNPYFPPDVAGKIIDNDFAWAAKNRTRILEAWRARYEGKSEPKKK